MGSPFYSAYFRRSRRIKASLNVKVDGPNSTESSNQGNAAFRWVATTQEKTVQNQKNIAVNLDGQA